MDTGIRAAIDALDSELRRSVRVRLWLRSRRWCGEAIGARTAIAIRDRAVLSQSGSEALALFLLLAKDGRIAVPVHLPLAITASRPEADAFELSVGHDRWYVSEGERRGAYARFLVEGFRHHPTTRTSAGDRLVFRGGVTGSYVSTAPVPAEDSSNLLVHVSTSSASFVFKSYKFMDPRNREPEILERLHRRRFPNAPGYIGDLSLGRGRERIVLGVATEHVDARNAFSWVVDGLREGLDDGGGAGPSRFEAVSLDDAGALGQATAALHQALLDHHAGPFGAETFSSDDADAARRAAIANLGRAVRGFTALAEDDPREAGERATWARQMLLANRSEIEKTLRGLDASVGTPKCVIHGDLHLGQVLRRNSDGGLLFIDFEGEPARAPGQRFAKLPPLRDIASMNRSFAYARHYVWRAWTGAGDLAPLRLMERGRLSTEESSVADRLRNWERAVRDRFSSRYLARSEVYDGVDRGDVERAISGWTMEKALYELRYELQHRTANALIPLEGVLALGQRGPPATNARPPVGSRTR